MKKIIAIALAFCLMVTVLPAMAGGLDELLTMFSGSGESGSEEGMNLDLSGLSNLLSESGDALSGDGGSDLDLSSLANLFGGSGDAMSGNGGSDLDLGSLAGLLGGSGDTAGENNGSGLDLGGLANLFGGSGESGMDLSSLGSLFSGTGGEEGQEFDFGALLGMFGGGKATAVNTVAANSAEQFYGTWTVQKLSAAGYELGLDFLKQFGMEKLPTVTLTADSLIADKEDGNKETKAVTASDFTDGALTITVDDTPAKLQLTDEGYVLCSVSGASFGVDMTLDVLLVPAP